MEFGLVWYFFKFISEFLTHLFVGTFRMSSTIPLIIIPQNFFWFKLQKEYDDWYGALVFANKPIDDAFLLTQAEKYISNIYKCASTFQSI